MPFASHCRGLRGAHCGEGRVVHTPSDAVVEVVQVAISDALRDRVFAWVADDPDLHTSKEALALYVAGDSEALSDCFGGSLEFGTAGLRGTIGPGPNRMNRAVVRRTTAGLCMYLMKTVAHSHSKGIVIGRDARNGSDRFSRDAAMIAMGLGFTVHYFEDPVPTPLVAFAVRELGAAGGVVVTASHNPPEYNGYKVYWNTGGQIVPPQDDGIRESIDAIASIKKLALVDREVGRTIGTYRAVSSEIERRYLAAISALDFGQTQDKNIVVAYTPLHGVGGRIVKRALEWNGFGDVHVTPGQAEPDGDFPTVKFPNPEEPGAMDLVLALAREKKADLVLANDPDADRMAAAYRTKDGEYVMLSGNQIGVLLGHHRLVDDPRPAPDRAVVTTIVSSPMLGHIAQKLGVRYAETLTGFKWIARKSQELEQKYGSQFVFGYEEALGSSTGTIVADKDGVSAALVMTRLAAHLKSKGQTLGDRLDEIERKFGVYVSSQHNATYSGAAGAKVIDRIMNGLRTKMPWQLGGEKVLSIRDFKTGMRHLSADASEAIEFPASNVLSFDLSDGARVVARPSGTEPKIKYYFDVRTTVEEGEELDSARARGRERLEAIQKAFVALADGYVKR